MVVSVSRRTDVPAWYAPWFWGRLAAGTADVANPMNPRQIKRVDLSPQAVDCFVFWSKNPAPMLPGLAQLGSRAYYFQYTLNGYGVDVEPGLPAQGDRVDTFLRLAERIGPRRVIWRYDPVLLGGPYTVAQRLEEFARLAGQLRGATQRCVVSFLDEYASVTPRLRKAGLRRPGPQEIHALAAGLGAIAARHGLAIAACAEEEDLSPWGIGRARCVDPDLIETLCGRRPQSAGAKLRRHCGCAPSVDIGSYDSCPHGCLYCYANRSADLARRNHARHRPDGAQLLGPIP